MPLLVFSLNPLPSLYLQSKISFSAKILLSLTKKETLFSPKDAVRELLLNLVFICSGFESEKMPLISTSGLIINSFKKEFLISNIIFAVIPSLISLDK